MSWKRIALYVVGLNLLLFFRGCEQTGEIHLTSGAIVPYQMVTIDEAGFHEGFELASFSFPLLALNLALCAALLVLIKRYLPKLDAFLARKSLLVITGIIFVLFNLVLIPNHIWAYAVFWPTGYLYEIATNLLYGGEPVPPAVAVIDAVSRLYLLLSVAVLSLIPLLCSWIKKKLDAAPGPSCLVGTPTPPSSKAPGSPAPESQS